MLPPVEPPSVGFLVQLFFVPGVIVAIIVGVWLTFHWLAHLGNDPQAYLRTLRRNSEGRWQAALNFANDLRGPGGGALKADAALATEVASVLDDEVAKGRTNEQSQQLKLYLCRALGEFSVPEAVPPLVARASDLGDLETARAAVEALAVLTTNLVDAGSGLNDHQKVVDVVVAASKSDDQRLRGSAAFALGIVGGNDAATQLIVMQSDASDDVRFNAATALARLGRDEAYETLAEMLALTDLAAGPDEQSQSERYKRALVVVNALRAVALLVDAVGSQPPGGILSRIKELREDPVSDVQAAATALLDKVSRLGPS
jgi:HEAT repeat protein